MTTTNAAHYGPRPPLGDLVAGQPVIVRRSSNDMRGRKAEDRYISARVVKAARVWVELASVSTRTSWDNIVVPERTWRMRMDTQNEATEFSGSNDQFLTLPQYQWQIARDWARSVLTEQGIRLDTDSPWRKRIVELADLLSKTVDTSQS